MKWLRHPLLMSSFLTSLAFATPSTGHAIGGKAIDFGTVYVGQWIFYGVNQAEIIRQHGSLENMTKYPFQPRFDQDDFNYNVVKHSLAGNYYYLFYRSRGYAVKEAFFHTVLSSLAFEFTIETMTERPSYQDMYQTPVFGTVVGIGAEKLSLDLVTSESMVARFFGYVVNPFLLLPSSTFRLAWIPPVDSEAAHVMIAGEF